MSSPQHKSDEVRLNQYGDPMDPRKGAISAVFAYLIWGFFPLMFRMLDGVNPVIIVTHRVVWSLLFVAIILKLNGRLPEVRAAFSDRRAMIRIGLAALMLTCNWTLYVWAIEAELVLQTSFGYFINPLFNVALGVVFLGERQNRWQMLSIGIALIAVVIQAVAIGGLPWVALVLAALFAIYGYLRKTVNVGSAPGLMVETILMFPLAVGFLAYTFITQGAGPHADPNTMMWLIITGPATAGALLFFAYGARNLRLTTIGMIQYIAPSMHFLTAVFVFGESMNGTQLFSFALIWLSLVIFSMDSLRNKPAGLEKENG